MKYNFIEIGTSNFETLIETATDDIIGISVEPIGEYLNDLPNPPGVKKLKCAVSRNNLNETLEVYYIPPDVIKQYQLPHCLTGCNAVGGYHFLHTAWDVQQFVVHEPVPCIPISQLFEENDVTELDYLKLDTEGSDCDILLHLYKYLQNQPASRYPKKILFESNELSVPAQVELVKERFGRLGYRVTSQTTWDTTLEL
jgi:hypothetical protein